MTRLILIVSALVLSTSQVQPAAAGAWLPLKAMGIRVDGVWRSQGYGQLLVLRGGVPTLFHTAGPYCYRDPRPNAGGDDTFHSVAIVRRDRISFTEAPGQTQYVFDRIAKLPSECLTKQRW